jgi:hypothetical protein
MAMNSPAVALDATDDDWMLPLVRIAGTRRSLRDLVGNCDPVVMLRGCEGPRPDAKVASDPVAPSRFLRLALLHHAPASHLPVPVSATPSRTAAGRFEGFWRG